MFNDDSSSRRGSDSQQLQVTPPPPPPPKRKRTSKATSSQFEELLEKLEARPYLATRRFTGLQGKENFDVGWKEVAQHLNQSHNGAVKTAEQWMTVWRDLKSRCSTKAAKLNKERAQTGNRGVNTPPLTELEKRVISLIGLEYTIGTSCPDAMPEDAIQRDLEAGVDVDPYIDLSHSDIQVEGQTDTYVIVDPVIIASDRIDIDTESRQQYQPSTSQQALELIASDRIDIDTESRQQHQPSSSQALEMTTGGDQNTRQQRRQQLRRNRNLNPRRSVAEQHNSARSDFLAVAQSNADAMKVLAAATKTQAEAAKIQAEAAKTQADALMLFAEAANKLTDIIIDQIKK